MLYRILQKAAFPATKYVIYSSVRAQAPKPMLTQWKSQLHTTPNLFASANDWQQIPAPNHPIIEKLQKHPEIMQQLVDFTSLLQEKGVDVSGKQPSFMQVMKVMNDPEIKTRVQILAASMKSAGIQLDLQTIQELQADFKNLADQYTTTSTEQPVEEQKKNGRTSGVLNKVKGLFKK